MRTGKRNPWIEYSDAMEKLQEVIIFKRTTAEAYATLWKDKTSLATKKKSPKLSVEEENKIQSDAVKAFIRSVDYPPLIYRMSMVYAVSLYEMYFNNFLTYLFEKDPRRLITSKKTLTYEEILTERSTKKIIEKIIKRELYEIGYKSQKDKFQYLEQRFNISFESINSDTNFLDEKINFTAFNELFSTRNLIVHNDAIVNEIYKKDNPESKLKIGQQRHITAEYVVNSVMLLMMVVSKLYYKLKEFQKG